MICASGSGGNGPADELTSIQPKRWSVAAIGPQQVNSPTRGYLDGPILGVNRNQRQRIAISLISLVHFPWLTHRQLPRYDQIATVPGNPIMQRKAYIRQGASVPPC